MRSKVEDSSRDAIDGESDEREIQRWEGEELEFEWKKGVRWIYIMVGGEEICCGGEGAGWAFSSGSRMEERSIVLHIHLTYVRLSVSLGIIVEGPCPELITFRDASSASDDEIKEDILLY